MAKIAVLGAGVGGLCTAALLARDGHRPVVYEKDSRVGGRTASTKYRNHTLDNGFHIMPFYKKSAIYRVLCHLGICDMVQLVKVTDIAFHAGSRFHRYPAGISDILSMSLVPLRNRLALLRLLLPMAFSRMSAAERLDDRPLSDVIRRLDGPTRAFFDAVCMLAFADTPDRVALGEFVRTIIRANPFRGGTSRFAYPAGGGYDTICKALASYVVRRGGDVRLSCPVRRVETSDGRVCGVTDISGDCTGYDCVVVSLPSYQATGLFGPGTLTPDTVRRMTRLDEATSVVEVHYATDQQMDTRHVVFPVGDYTAKGIFFTSNITPAICPRGEHQIISGTPVDPRVAGSSSEVARVAGRMREDIQSIYPGFADHIIWERAMAWRLVESVVKKPGMVWRSKMPHHTPDVRGLFFVGDSTISYGIGTDSAAHSSLLCHPRIREHLSGVS